MTKQNFMAMNLPYGLKVSTIKSVEYVRNFCLYDTRYFRLEFEISENSNDFRKSYPILYPLSDYQKIKHLIDVTDKIGIISVIDGDFDFTKLRFDLILKLVQNHFDFLGLIEKGEAINVNTLEVNPYK